MSQLGTLEAGIGTACRRVDFRAFMNEVTDANRDKEIHVIRDNLSTHKPKRDMWLARHKNVRFHYAPTHTSWLNHVEIWFSILARYSRPISTPSSTTMKPPSPRLIRSEVHRKRLKPYFVNP